MFPKSCQNISKNFQKSTKKVVRIFQKNLQKCFQKLSEYFKKFPKKNLSKNKKTKRPNFFHETVFSKEYFCHLHPSPSSFLVGNFPVYICHNTRILPVIILLYILLLYITALVFCFFGIS